MSTSFENGRKKALTAIQNSLDYGKIQKQADRMASNAKDGTLKVGSTTYQLKFNPYQGVYIVTDASGQDVTNFNTKTLSTAKKWLQEWLNS